MNSSNIMRLRSIMIIAMVLLLNLPDHGQGLSISTGTILMTTGGSMVLKGNLVNNGSFNNINSTIVFSGNTQLTKRDNTGFF